MTQVQEAPVSIREFFPETLCGRGENGQVTLLAGCEVAYGEMLDKFRSHARVLARLRDLPTMIRCTIFLKRTVRLIPSVKR